MIAAAMAAFCGLPPSLPVAQEFSSKSLLFGEQRFFQGFHAGACLKLSVCKGSGKNREVLRNPFEHKLLRRLEASITQRGLLDRGDKILVTVSGGQDSISLLWLLNALRPLWGWRLGVVHCDHRWRSTSRAQGSHVAQVAAQMGIDYYQAVATRGVLDEGSARTWRYGIIQRMAISHGYGVIVTAHTASDRVETLLYNMFRGSGLNGLQSLMWRRTLSASLNLSSQGAAFSPSEGPILAVIDQEGKRGKLFRELALVRPMLDVTRTEVRCLCGELRLPLWPDPSNESLYISRNRIRRQLMPYLRQNFHGDVDKSLARWAEIAQGEQAYLQDVCDDTVSRMESPYAPDGGGPPQGRKLDAGALQALPLALQRRVLKAFVERFTGRVMGFDHVERARIACWNACSCESGIGMKMDVPGNCYLQFLEHQMIILKPEAAQYSTDSGGCSRRPCVLYEEENGAEDASESEE